MESGGTQVAGFEQSFEVIRQTGAVGVSCGSCTREAVIRYFDAMQQEAT